MQKSIWEFNTIRDWFLTQAEAKVNSINTEGKLPEFHNIAGHSPLHKSNKEK